MEPLKLNAWLVSNGARNTMERERGKQHHAQPVTLTDASSTGVAAGAEPVVLGCASGAGPAHKGGMANERYAPSASFARSIRLVQVSYTPAPASKCNRQHGLDKQTSIRNHHIIMLNPPVAGVRGAVDRVGHHLVAAAVVEGKAMQQSTIRNGCRRHSS